MKNFSTIYKVTFLFFLCQSPLLLSAQIDQDTASYNLKRILILARQNNKDMQLVSLGLQKTQQQISLKKSVFLPKIDAFANYYNYVGNVPLAIFPESEGQILSGGISNGVYPVSVGLPNNFLAGVSLSQRLFEFSYLNFGKSKDVFNGIESARLKEKQEQLYYDVAVCYYEIQQLKAKGDLIDFNISRLTRMIEVTEIQLNNQMTDSLQLLDLNLKKAWLLLQKREYISGLERKTDYLKMLAGLPATATISFDTVDYMPVVGLFHDTLAVSKSTQMNLLDQAGNLNSFSQKQVQSEYLPTLDFKFNLLWNSQSQNMAFFSNEAFGNNISTLGLKLDIPIYHGAEKKKKLQELKIDRHILEIQKEKLKEGFQLQYSGSVKELEYKSDRYLHQKEITSLKKLYLDKANRQFEQGILPVKDLLEAQSALLEAQMKTTELLFDLKLAELDYYKLSNQILARLE
jgi:outer membrane protein TolC